MSFAKCITRNHHLSQDRVHFHDLKSRLMTLSPPPGLWQPSIFRLPGMVSPFLKCHTNRIMSHVLFRVCCLRLACFCAQTISRLRDFYAEQHSAVPMYHTICLSISQFGVIKLPSEHSNTCLCIDICFHFSQVHTQAWNCWVLW